MENWLKNPTILIIGAVVLVGGYVLLKNNQGSATPQTGTSSNPQLSNLGNSGQTPVGQSYSYLDGSGMQHLTATDPYGNLTSYQTMPPSFYDPSTSGQLASYVGMMGSPMFMNPYGGTTPYYSQLPTTGDFAFNQSPTITG